MIVVDASAFIDATDGNRAVIERMAGEGLHTPHLLDIEVVGALSRLVTKRRPDAPRAVSVLRILGETDLHRHSPRDAMHHRGFVTAGAAIGRRADLDAWIWILFTGNHSPPEGSGVLSGLVPPVRIYTVHRHQDVSQPPRTLGLSILEEVS